MDEPMVMRALAFQNNMLSSPDGLPNFVRANRRMELITPDWMTQLAMEGRVFELSNPTHGTAVAMGGTAYSDTAAAFSIDVPTGTTIVPLEVQLRQGGTVAGGVITALLTVDNKARYSSGGTALTPKNIRTDITTASLTTAYSGGSALTIVASQLQRTFWASLLSPDVTPTADVAFPAVDSRVDWSAKMYTPPVLVGPASLVIYTFAGTTQPSWFYHITWAEMPSLNVI